MAGHLSMALVPELAGAGPLVYHTFADEHAFQEKTEEVLREVAEAARRSGRPEAEVRRRMRSNDAARAAYVRHFYRCDPADPRHYHLVIDTTAVPWDTAADLVVTAALARGM